MVCQVVVLSMNNDSAMRMSAIRPSILLLASLVFGCSNPPNTATGQLTIDGTNIALISVSYGDVAYAKDLDLGLYPPSDKQYYGLEVDWNGLSDSGATIDLSDGAVGISLEVENDGNNYLVVVGPFASAAPDPTFNNNGTLVGTATGSLSLGTTDRCDPEIATTARSTSG